MLVGKVGNLVKFGIFLIILKIHNANSLKDVVFAVERSSRISADELHNIIQFISNVTQLLDIGTNATLLSVVTFSSSVRVEFALKDFTDKHTLLNAINSLKHVIIEGESYTNLALNVIKQYVLHDGNGARPNAEAVVIVLTKGLASDTNFTVNVSDNLQKDGPQIYCVGLGPLEAAWKSELENIATKPSSEFLYKLDSSVLLPELVHKFVNILDGNTDEIITEEEKYDLSTASSLFASDQQHGNNDDILVAVFVVIGLITGVVFIYLIVRMNWKQCTFTECKKYSRNGAKYNKPADREHDLYGDLYPHTRNGDII